MQQEARDKNIKEAIDAIKLAYKNLAKELSAAKKEHRDRINALVNRVKERRVKEIQDKLKSF